ncbi:hypothetical protein [Klebsiella oxytoca]|uniref:hypothetical protein n=1 Tax=Klebsiella oxytoca TaxID=571 RepID=UPI002593D5C6|nr:hypothetical protein [Klebsiella oxytoca]MDM4499750.1 hypothetical protein [Klebsiella oxytoca]
MTPRQRRNHRAGLEIVSKATRKSWLGRFTPLSGIQSAWIKSLLTVWGEGVRGGMAPRKPTEHSCWRGLKGGRWSDKVLERFTAAIEQARREGFSGPQALNRARSILWPHPTTSLIDTAIHDDDVEFIEKCVLEAFETGDPVYTVGVSYYTTRKNITDITRELQLVAPWLTDGEARKRVRWCLEIFRAKAFLSVKREIHKD